MEPNSGTKKLKVSRLQNEGGFLIAHNWIPSLFVTASFKLRFGGLRSHGATSAQRRIIAEFFRENYKNGTSGKKRDTFTVGNADGTSKIFYKTASAKGVTFCDTLLTGSNLSRPRNGGDQEATRLKIGVSASANVILRRLFTGTCCQGGDLAERIILPG